MVTADEIAACFRELNVTVSVTILHKCLEICLNYNVGAEDFCDQWYAFTASNLNGAAPTIEFLERMERKEFQKNKQNVSKQYKSYDKSLTRSEDLNDAALISTYSTATPKRAQQIPVQNTPPTVKKIVQNSKESPSTSLSEKYSHRDDSRTVQCNYGSATAQYKRETDFPVSIKILPNYTLPADVRYMYEILGKKAQSMNNFTQYLGHKILQTHGLALSEGILKTQLGELTTYGRIVSDSNGKINVQSVLLEGTQESNLHFSTILNLNKMTKCSLFPGQVVAVQGNNVNKSKFIAEKIFSNAVLDFPENPPGDPLQVVIAAGPFTLPENVSYEPLHDLLKYVEEHKPHVLLLMGPFIEKTHESIHNGGLAQTFDSFFEGLMENIANSLQNIDLEVIIMSSLKDAHHHPVYPTPPYKIREKYNKFTFVSDPCVIDVNGLVIGATTADILCHISNFELYYDRNPVGLPDRMARLASHVLNQNNFYPLYPPHKEMYIDHELLEQFGVMKYKPHVLVLPSNLKHFVKNIQDCLVINPERLTKGHVAGTFARIEISPGDSKSICNRVSCQILRV